MLQDDQNSPFLQPHKLCWQWRELCHCLPKFKRLITSLPTETLKRRQVYLSKDKWILAIIFTFIWIWIDGCSGRDDVLFLTNEDIISDKKGTMLELAQFMSSAAYCKDFLRPKNKSSYRRYSTQHRSRE